MQDVQAREIASPGWRYCFLLPDLWRPVGGMAVLYDTATALREAGHDTALVHAGPRHRYPFADTTCDVFHLPELAQFHTPHRLRDRFRRIRARLAERRANPRTPRFRPSARDVFVLPEFCYEDYAGLFSDAPLVLMAQDAAGLLRAYSRDRADLHRRFVSVLATSEASAEAVHILLSREPHRLILPVARPGLQPDHPKKLQIAYMPRKLRAESQQVTMALRRRPALADIPIVAIENMTNEERDRVLNESLIFLSFSDQEGFGLPPAEAMAAGCIVLGYTGVGGNEYFTPRTGFVIEHGDMPRFVAQVEKVVTDYRCDPAALDRLRAEAAACIATRYSATRARQSLLDSWAAMEADLRARQT